MSENKIDPRYSHRTSSKKVCFTGKDGKALGKKKVHVELVNHKFLFGQGSFDVLRYVTCEDAKEKEFLGERVQRLVDLYNYGTLPFYWGLFERNEGEPLTEPMKKAAQFLKDHDITVKGHPLCWHTVCAPWLLQYDDQTILDKQMARIEREVTNFKGLIDMWDAINEVCIMPVFDKYDNAVTRICNYKGPLELTKMVFEKSVSCNPDGVFLINDFNTTDRYAELIQNLLDNGVPIKTIGIQSHQHQGYWGLEKLNQVLERFEKFGLPIHFTENTIVSGDLIPPEIEDLNDFVVDEWPSTKDGEERQARELTEIYKTLFEHPLVEAITGWDLCDGEWLGAPSGVLHKDNTPKPAYFALKDLIKKEWRTSYDAVTDENGNIDVTGFKGKYKLSTEDDEMFVQLD